MTPLALTFPTLAVSMTYCLWYAYREALARRESRLRARVAQMLWEAAQHVE